MEEKLTVMGIGAHPDDLEILCSGTLAKYAELGHEVWMCHINNGNKGHFVIPPDELVVIREKEAQKASAIIGARHLNLGVPDCELYYNKESQDKVIDAIRKVQPDVIITHSPDDYMPDHVAVSQLVFSAGFNCSLPHYKTREPATNKIPVVYYMDTLVGIDFLPTEYVDITDTIEKKQQAVNAHESQTKWLKEHDNIDMVEFVTSIARFRGIQSGVQYAEGFRHMDRWPRNVNKRLLP